jgi:hypothetical protein
MTTLDTVVASLPDSRLSLGGLLKRLHLQGRLEPLVREALSEQLVAEEARRAGLSVPVPQLQTAADAFRRRQGLNTNADTRAWLTARGMSLEDLETRIEETVLSNKLRQHLTAAQVEGHFSANATGFEVLVLAILLVDRDDLARELVSQIRDEGRDLDAVAGEHGLAAVRRQMLRKDLNAPLAAALASANTGELVGPVATPQGFALVVVQERRPAVLDPATRQRIQAELFDQWLAGRMKGATLDLGLVGTSG